MGLNSGSVRIDYLCSSRLHCVDCTINGNRLEAGYIYSDGMLKPIEVLEGEGLSIRVQIPLDLQQMRMPADWYLANEDMELEIYAP